MNEKIIRKKSNVVIIRRNVRVNKSGKGIGRPHSRTRDMNKVKIKILEKHHPACLAARQFLRLAEVHKILVIGEESDRVTGALEVVVPVVQGMDDSKQLAIIDVIISAAVNI